jgi:hypothetical protein
MAWIVEQLYLAIQQSDRSDSAVRERVRLFLIPALTPDRVAVSTIDCSAELDAISSTLAAATRATDALRRRVMAGGPTGAAAIWT